MRRPPGPRRIRVVLAAAPAAALAAATVACTQGTPGQAPGTGPDVVTVAPRTSSGVAPPSALPGGRGPLPGASSTQASTGLMAGAGGPESVLGALTAGASSSPAGAAGVAATIGRATGAPGLGAAYGITVLNPATGAVLLSKDGGRGFTPASTMKLLTATAVLGVLGPAHRFQTRVALDGAAGGVARLVLVGGGDPSLTGAAPGAALSGDAAQDPVADPARLSALVAKTVAALRARRITTVTVAVDDHLFSGPDTAASWPRDYVEDGVIGPVDALALDGGRRAPGSITRVPDPAAAAGAAFAAGLTAAGIAVRAGDPDAARDPDPIPDGSSPAAAIPSTATTIASVSSPRLVDLLHHMLLASDNDYAEALFRQVAVGSGAAGTFAVAAATVSGDLDRWGIDPAGSVLLDGSGLSRGDRLPPLLLARTVTLDLRLPALAAIPRSLPVAGRSGTLTARFTGAAAAAGRGRVLAKTGTLTGVDNLAGYVLTRTAGPLVVVVLADDTPGTAAAQSAIDVLAARLVYCGCHG